MVPEELSYQQLSASILQPITENAIKHGTSQLPSAGEVSVATRREGQHLVLDIEDNAGLYQPALEVNGLDINLVDK